MRAVHKFPVPASERFSLEMPRGTQLLHVAAQGTSPGAAPQLWASVDLDQKELEWRKFVVVATGQSYDASTLIYIGTFMLEDGGIVFHLFETLG